MKLSRRSCLTAGLGAVIASREFLCAQPQQTAADLALVNGKFVDGRGVVGSTLTIKNGRIGTVGKAATATPGTRTIDLGGRTVIPGFFDAHAHYARAAMNPGHEARRIERAFSIAEMQDAIAKRAQS